MRVVMTSQLGAQTLGNEFVTSLHELDSFRQVPGLSICPSTISEL